LFSSHVQAPSMQRKVAKMAEGKTPM